VLRTLPRPGPEPPPPAQDLARYGRPAVPGNRGPAWRAAWYVVGALVFRGALLGLVPGAWKAALLRAFGARVGRGLVAKPGARIKYPWLLEVGDHVWIGEDAWIDNVGPVRLGSNVCVSQGAYLGTGNHDWGDPGFRFFAAPVEVGDGAWIGARAVVCPGSRVGPGAVLCAGAVLSGEARAGTVHAGNPARPVRPRAAAPARPAAGP
jgi:putative colanic acid biosynthesis acetyltransferase WcaF